MRRLLGGWLAFAVVTTFAAAAWAGPPPRAVETPLGGWYREGRPVLLRVPGAARVRAPSAAWALPRGEALDEFLLVGAAPEGGRLRLTVEDALTGDSSEVFVPLRPLPDGRALTAVLDGSELADGEVAVPAGALESLIIAAVSVPIAVAAGAASPGRGRSQSGDGTFAAGGGLAGRRSGSAAPAASSGGG